MTCDCPSDLTFPWQPYFDRHVFFNISISLSLKIKQKLSCGILWVFTSFYDVFIRYNCLWSQFRTVFWGFGQIQKSKMADQYGRYSEMGIQLLCHVTSSPHNANIRGDIFRHTIYPPSVVIIAFILSELRNPRPPVVEDKKKPGLNRVKVLPNLPQQQQVVG